MPQPKKHASPAARQAAYRRRTQGAHQADLLARGLPALPVIATMPGGRRWNAALSSARVLATTTLGEMEEYFQDRSEQWRESNRGAEHQDRTAAVEAALDALDEALEALEGGGTG
jgi:hypothetical protein